MPVGVGDRQRNVRVLAAQVVGDDRAEVRNRQQERRIAASEGEDFVHGVSSEG